jgi:hypothetical protein
MTLYLKDLWNKLFTLFDVILVFFVLGYCRLIVFLKFL